MDTWKWHVVDMKRREFDFTHSQDETNAILQTVYLMENMMIGSERDEDVVHSPRMLIV